MNFKSFIKNVPDFPVEGIQFKDITPLLDDADAFHDAVDEMASYAKKMKANKIVGPDARGFIFGASVAYATRLGFVPVRKPGKLPRETLEIEYDLEYGTNTLCVHKDDIGEGDKVIIIDDLLATGGTVKASIELIEQAGAEVVGLAFLIELSELGGSDKIEGYPYKTLIRY